MDIRRIILLLAVSLLPLPWGLIHADLSNPLGLVMTRSHAPEYTPGEALEITVTIEGAVLEPITAIGLGELLPEGWSFVSARGYHDPAPSAMPRAGAGPRLEFVWITPPPLPYTIIYTVMMPAGDGGDKVIMGDLEYRIDGGAHYTPTVITEVSGPPPIPPLILLEGANPLVLRQGVAWREPGYTALDHNDMDISSLVVVVGEVDTGSPGEYRLHYSVKVEETGLTAQTDRLVRVVATDQQTDPAFPQTAVPGEGMDETTPVAGQPDTTPPGRPGTLRDDPVSETPPGRDAGTSQGPLGEGIGPIGEGGAVRSESAGASGFVPQASGLGSADAQPEPPVPAVSIEAGADRTRAIAQQKPDSAVLGGVPSTARRGEGIAGRPREREGGDDTPSFSDRHEWLPVDRSHRARPNNTQPLTTDVSRPPDRSEALRYRSSSFRKLFIGGALVFVLIVPAVVAGWRKAYGPQSRNTRR